MFLWWLGSLFLRLVEWTRGSLHRYRVYALDKDDISEHLESPNTEVGWRPIGLDLQHCYNRYPLILYKVWICMVLLSCTLHGDDLIGCSFCLCSLQILNETIACISSSEIWFLKGVQTYTYLLGYVKILPHGEILLKCSCQWSFQFCSELVTVTIFHK